MFDGLDKLDWHIQAATTECADGTTALDIGLIHNQTFTAHYLSSEGFKNRKSAARFFKPFHDAVKQNDWDLMPECFQHHINKIIDKLESDIADGKLNPVLNAA